MVRLCCWKRQTPLEEVAEEQLRESKMGLKPKPFKTIGPPCLLGLEPPQSMCSYRSAERLAPPPPSSGNPVLGVSDGEVSHYNSMELSSCAERDNSVIKAMELQLPQNNISRSPSPASHQLDSQASLSSTANFGENNICKKLSFSQSPVPRAQYKKSYVADAPKASMDISRIYNGTKTSDYLHPLASPSLRLIKELDLDTEDWEWEDVVPSENI